MMHRNVMWRNLGIAFVGRALAPLITPKPLWMIYEHLVVLPGLLCCTQARRPQLSVGEGRERPDDSVFLSGACKRERQESQMIWNVVGALIVTECWCKAFWILIRSRKSHLRSRVDFAEGVALFVSLYLETRADLSGRVLKAMDGIVSASPSPDPDAAK